MTTSTKRPDGGELKARIWDGYGCPDCKGTGENLANPINAGLCQTCSGTGSRTPANESPAPQAEAEFYMPNGMRFYGAVRQDESSDIYYFIDGENAKIPLRRSPGSLK